MLRKRDFFLLVVIIVFLLVAIGTTIIISFNSTGFSFEMAKIVSDSDEEYVAVVEDTLEQSRAERLSEMRRKIENGGSLAISEPIESQLEPEDTETEGPLPEVTAEMRCGNYSPYQGGWDGRGIKLSEIEGIRLVYREIKTSAAIPTGTTSPAQVAPQKDILLELPVRSISFGGQNCVASDVIGVTLGGSLIRNSEAKLYAPTAEGTLLGYALDGYPIYGSSSSASDVCGGRTVTGVYRYQLSSKRETIINCYTAAPVQL